MQTDKKILIAFLLNLFFSAFEFFGGAITGSVAIVSDALHDLGDAAGIGLSYFFEKKSKKKPDESYTYGYLRYSVMGSLVITVILLSGSVLVIYKASERLFNPTEIDYNGMLVFAALGTAVNFFALLFTKDGDSLNRKAVSLHMLEDTLGWVAVLVGAVIMRLTDFHFIDPLLSIGVAVFIFLSSLKNLKKALDVFLERVPEGISVDEIREHINSLIEVKDVHHIHLWSMDGYNNYITMHIVTDGDTAQVKSKIRAVLLKCGIHHSVIETEREDENCSSRCCRVEKHTSSHHHHHCHHHH